MNFPAGKSDVTKRFTVEQANRMLPLARAIVKDLVAQQQVVKQLTNRLEVLGKFKGKKSVAKDEEFSDEIEGFRRELDAERSKLDAFRQELQRLGLHAGTTEGHCDFPGLVEGQEVDLCWQLNEPEILFWHPSGSVFLDRRPLVVGAGAKFEDRTANRSWNDLHG